MHIYIERERERERYTYMHIHMYIHIYIYGCMYTYIHLNIHVYVNICLFKKIHIRAVRTMHFQHAFPCCKGTMVHRAQTSNIKRGTGSRIVQTRLFWVSWVTGNADIDTPLIRCASGSCASGRCGCGSEQILGGRHWFYLRIGRLVACLVATRQV